MTEHNGALRSAEVLDRSGRKPEALAIYRRIWAEGRSCVIAGVALAEAHVLSRAPEAALRIFEDLLRLDPTHVAVLELERELGIALYGMNLWEDAQALLQSASAREPWDEHLAKIALRTAPDDNIAPTVQDPISGRSLKRYSAREGDQYIFVIDIVGTCNLRCPTCPVGNTLLGDRGLGFMPLEMFELIVAKIRNESPSPEPIINLFNWGEPLLHPDLPKMIGILRAAGMRVHLSSNLNIKRGLKEVIAARPHDLKISLSGFSPQTYAARHTRGSLSLVKENMKAIRRYLDETGSPTRVWVGQHIYKSNRSEAAETERFAKTLGFGYASIPAYYMPMERVVDLIEGRPNSMDGGVIEDLLHAPQDRSNGPNPPDPALDCELRFNQTVINHDGSVALCCSVYERPQMLGVQFLDLPFADIEAMKYRHAYCETCRGYQLDYRPPRQVALRLPQEAGQDGAAYVAKAPVQ